MTADPLARAHPALAVVLVAFFGPFAYLYTLELQRMVAAILLQVGLLVAYAAVVTHLFLGGLQITSLAGKHPLDQALVASPAILAGGLAIALLTQVAFAVDLAWRIARARQTGS